MSVWLVSGDTLITGPFFIECAAVVWLGSRFYGKMLGVHGRLVWWSSLDLLGGATEFLDVLLFPVMKWRSPARSVWIKHVWKERTWARVKCRCYFAVKLLQVYACIVNRVMFYKKILFFLETKDAAALSDTHAYECIVDRHARRREVLSTIVEWHVHKSQPHNIYTGLCTNIYIYPIYSSVCPLKIADPPMFQLIN